MPDEVITKDDNSPTQGAIETEAINVPVKVFSSSGTWEVPAHSAVWHDVGLFMIGAVPSWPADTPTKDILIPYEKINYIEFLTDDASATA